MPNMLAGPTAFHMPDRKVKYDGRCIELRWLLREEPQEDGDIKRTYAELSVQHHGRAEIAGRPDRCFTATLSRAYITDRANGMTSQTFGLGRQAGLPSVRIPSEPCARFSAKRLEAFADKALLFLRRGAEAGDEDIAANFDPAR